MIRKFTLTNSIAKHIAACSMLGLAGLGGCSEGGTTAQPDREPSQAELEAVWQEAEPIIEKELAEEAARSAVHFPCTLFDKEAAGTLLNAKVGAPEFAHEFKTEQNADTGESSSWQAEACSWNNRGDGASMNVWVSRREQFPGSTVQCHGIYDEDITESMLGGKAKWEFLESFGWAKLVVCREDALFFVEINRAPADEIAAKAIAVEIAERVNATLR